MSGPPPPPPQPITPVPDDLDPTESVAGEEDPGSAIDVVAETPPKAPRPQAPSQADPPKP